MSQKHFSLFIAVLLAATTFSSCEKVIDFDGEETEPIMVMISFPDSGNPWKVRLTESRFFLSNDTIATIKNADVTTEVNGRPTNSLVTYMGNGVYDLGYTPQAGDSLTLHVSVPGKGTMKAGCRIPGNVSVSDFSCTSLDTTWTKYIYDNSEIMECINGSVEGKFTLNDPAGERNYYMIKFSTTKRTFRPGPISDNPPQWVSGQYFYLSVDDDVLFDINATDEIFDIGGSDNADYGYEILFTDERINGQSHTIHFSTNINDTKPESAYLEVYSVSHEYYMFKKTLRAARNQDDFGAMFSEPVQLYSNVEGGSGVLGGASVAKIPIF